MNRLPSAVWGLLILVLAYLCFAYGVGPLTELLTDINAPLPSSLVLLYSGMVAMAILLYVSVREDSWKEFIDPVADFMRDSGPAGSGRRRMRSTVLVLLPVLLGWRAYAGAAAQPEPPADPPGVHFTLPNKYVAIENPFGNFDSWQQRDIDAGGVLYTMNCAMCHGDAQDGKGLFARAWQPIPANFREEGTIAQMPANYLFWRIKEGGPGIPRGSIEYRSVMPVWDGVLSDEEIWQVIMFEYVNAGKRPAVR